MSVQRPMRSVLEAVATVALLAALSAACSRAPDDETAATQEQASTQLPPRTVRLDPEMQHQLQFKTETLLAVTSTPELRTYGRVLDPTPLALSVAELTSAQAALAASEKEYARVKALLQQHNASERAVQAAEAEAARNRSLVQSARDRIALAWGPAVLQSPNLPALIRDLTAQKSELVRIDVAMDEALTDAPRTARVARATDVTQFASAELVGYAPMADPQLQGRGLLYLIRNNSLRLTPETAVVGFLERGGEALQGVRVPAAAILRHDAEPCVYVQRDATTFERIPLPAMQAIEGGWLLTSGLKAGDRVVTAGAQILLAEELKSQVRLQE
jgi:hypothetical protein